MAIGTNLNSNFPTSNQIPDHAILDYYNKQAYLGNQYIVSLLGVSGGSGSETNILWMQCPAGSTKSLFVSLRRLSAASNQVTVQNYIGPTVTVNGTAKTPQNLRPASTNTSIANVYTGPTVSSKGTLAGVIAAPTSLYVTTDNYSLYILDPGQSILWTCIAAGTTNINFDVIWNEI
jgi:hypothetical protein